MTLENYPLNVRAVLAQNPEAYLTERGVVVKQQSGYEEMLISIPDLFKQPYYLADHPELSTPAPLLIDQVGAVIDPEAEAAAIAENIVSEATVSELIATTEQAPAEDEKTDAEPDAEEKPADAPAEDAPAAPEAPEAKQEEVAVEHKKPGRKPKVTTATE